MAGGLFLFYTVVTRKGHKSMKVEKSFKQELSKLLATAASSEETEALKEMGINIKKPTRLTVLAAALYKKASGGDLSSLKEIIAALGEGREGNERVILLDDISKQT